LANRGLHAPKSISRNGVEARPNLSSTYERRSRRIRRTDAAVPTYCRGGKTMRASTATEGARSAPLDLLKHFRARREPAPRRKCARQESWSSRFSANRMSRPPRRRTFFGATSQATQAWHARCSSAAGADFLCAATSRCGARNRASTACRPCEWNLWCFSDVQNC
jgi:hypothetical protein